MGDKKQSKPHGFLEFTQQINHLRLHRHIQRRNRLVADHKFRLQNQCPGNADPLPLTAREFMRVSRHVIGLQAHFLEPVNDLIFHIRRT